MLGTSTVANACRLSESSLSWILKIGSPSGDGEDGDKSEGKKLQLLVACSLGLGHSFHPLVYCQMEFPEPVICLPILAYKKVICITVFLIRKDNL